jgi:hypothetical protein
VSTLRRLLVFTLLLTLPFQAALGATGLTCATPAPHAHEVAPVALGVDAAASVLHRHHPAAQDSGRDAAVEAGSPEPHGAAGKCKTCGECCSTAAPIPAAGPTLPPPATPLRVSAIVDPGTGSHTGDGLFRPPRNHPV